VDVRGSGDTVALPAASAASPGQQGSSERVLSPFDDACRGRNANRSGAHEVEGSLDVPNTPITGLVYEVAIADQRVSMGSLPDVGTIRSFANRDVPDPEGKHGFQQVSAFDFNVRIPRQALPPAALQHLRISLYRLHQAPKQSLGLEALRQQLSEEELSEVARLVGLPANRVAGPPRAELERVLQLRFQDKT